MSKIFSSTDASFLDEKSIAIIGYGSQGRSQAFNLRDSDVGDVIVVLPRDSKSIKLAIDDGFEVITDVTRAIELVDIIVFLLPDELHASVLEYVEPSVFHRKAFIFAHGLSVYSGLLKCVSDVDVCLVSPKAIGPKVREKYILGNQVPCFIGVWQDYSGDAHKIAESYAAAIGYGGCLVRSSFEEEAKSDLFGEQVVLCGGIPRLIINACDILIESGCSPEVAYFECLYELQLIVDLISKDGLAGMMKKISNAAFYGGVVSGSKIINNEVRNSMRDVFDNISNGAFATDFFAHSESIKQMRSEIISEIEELPISKVAKKISSLLD